MSKILIVEDEEAIADLERDYLELSGFTVEVANDGDTGLQKALNEDYDLLILDLMLPGTDGFDICRQVRDVKNTPIVMVSAKKDDIDKIRGLGLGADDYMVKPFEPKELLARVKAVLRRSDTKESNAEKEIVFPNLTINLSNYELKINGNIVEVPPKELELLYFLASNPNRVFTREQLLEEVWGFDYFGDSRTVDVHIKRLREKLEGVEANWQLKTVWGVGYKFEVR